jgi:valyl-tRNA synthetase
MSDLSKAYQPELVEEKWMQFWMENGFFSADSHSKKPAFSIVIPPPNVTGVLHMGHALVDTLQDVLIRWKRMSGFEALWVPGTDHAGIATQTVVERHLIATMNKRRKDFSREEFLHHIWQWKESSENQILSQLKRLGCSCDWSRLCFTMDEPRSRAVRTLFKKLFDAGLIYQGDYLVNWDPVTQTALADDEVEYEDRSSFLYYLRYPLENGSGPGYLTVATTRPETMLGDTAVAVSPTDDRYFDSIGKQVRLPLMNRLIPVLADPMVDPAFGTGIVKITPAHDPNDYEMARRHSLPLINVMTPDGKINENGKEFAGLPLLEARQKIVERLKALDLIEKIVPYEHRVGVSYRSKADIQPFLSKQWFIKMSPFKEKLISLVRDKKVKLIPPHWENTYFHWIENLRDWCISRQLWWGHRIPIWYHREDPKKILCYAGDDLPPEVKKQPDAWVQDEDVLDTWFSSALWPFSVFGWPEQTDDLNKFYPNATLITGHDILFFWVARMLMMGEYALREPPFPEVFLHGLIYGKSYWHFQTDGTLIYLSGQERMQYDLGTPIPETIHFKWEKMSKSKGNIIDPLEIIATYGADAMRIALCSSATSAPQIDLDRRRFEEFKHFTNKVWNGARFVLMNLETLTLEKISEGLKKSLFSLDDRWILSLLNKTVQDVDRHLTNYAFDKAAMVAYEFFWKDFCAYYVELTKPYLFGKSGTPDQKENKQKILSIVLTAVIRLLHPMTPFITEELFQLLKKHFFHAKMPARTSSLENLDPYTRATLEALEAAACVVAPYPKIFSQADIDPQIEMTFSFMDQMLHAIRNIRAEMQLPPGLMTSLFITGEKDSPDLKIVQDNQAILFALTRLHSIHFQEESGSRFAATAMVKSLKLTIPLPEEMKEKEKLRLVKEKERLIAQQNTLRGQLANVDFVQKAPPALVEKIKNNLLQAEKALEDTLKTLEEVT